MWEYFTFRFENVWVSNVFGMDFRKANFRRQNCLFRIVRSTSHRNAWKGFCQNIRIQRVSIIAEICLGFSRWLTRGNWLLICVLTSMVIIRNFKQYYLKNVSIYWELIWYTILSVSSTTAVLMRFLYYDPARWPKHCAIFKLDLLRYFRVFVRY